MNKRLSIRRLRKWNDLTQAEMANKLGMATSTYSQKEQGAINWTLADMVEIKKVFGVNIDELEEIQKMLD